MPHSSTKGRFLEKCLKSDKVRKGYAPYKKGPSLAGRTFQNIIVANYLFQPGFCPRLGFFIVSV